MESNIIKMQGNDGKEYALTLSYAKLYKLEKARPEEAQRYFDIQNKSEIENELEIIKVIYTAYLCAHLDEDNVMEQYTQHYFSQKTKLLRVIRGADF